MQFGRMARSRAERESTLSCKSGLYAAEARAPKAIGRVRSSFMVAVVLVASSRRCASGNEYTLSGNGYQ